MNRGFLRRAWLALLFAGTFGVIFWVGYITLMWGLVIADINPDSMPPLNGAQEVFVIEKTRAFMLLAAMPPVLLALLWGATVAALHARGQLPAPRDASRSDAAAPPSLP
jgi:hypothetical protein